MGYKNQGNFPVLLKIPIFITHLGHHNFKHITQMEFFTP
jgi:hypothetical protein